MKEAEILVKISQIVSTAASFTDTLERIRVLLEESLGAQVLTIESAKHQPSREDSVAAGEDAFLDSSALPYRSLYSVSLRAGGRELGKLIACYASSEFYGGVPQRVSQYVGEQLGMLLDRMRLGQDRRKLEAELAILHDDLATRKVLQRAQGILTARRGMTPASAKLWISLQARRSKLSVQQIASQVVAGDTAERQSVFVPRGRHIA